jgi:hypothetical protein
MSDSGPVYRSRWLSIGINHALPAGSPWSGGAGEGGSGLVVAEWLVNGNVEAPDAYVELPVW